jgi:hypothetical protein
VSGLKDRLTIPAVLTVISFGGLAVLQFLNIPLAIVAIAALVYLAVGRQFTVALISMAVSLLVSAMVGGQVLIIENVVLVLLPAAILTFGIRTNLSAKVAVFLVLIPVVIASAFYFAGVGSTDRYYAEIKPQIEQDFERMTSEINIQGNLNLSDEQMEDVRDNYLGFVRFLVKYLPGLLLISFMTIAGASYLLLQYLFEKRKMYIRRLPRFAVWKMPEGLLLLFGFSLLIVLLTSGLLEDIGENLALFCFTLFTLSGLSNVEFFMQKQKLSKFARFLIYFALFIFNIYGALILGIIGLADSHFDFRRVRATQIG